MEKKASVYLKKTLPLKRITFTFSHLFGMDSSYSLPKLFMSAKISSKITMVDR